MRNTITFFCTHQCASKTKSFFSCAQSVIPFSVVCARIVFYDLYQVVEHLICRELFQVTSKVL